MLRQFKIEGLKYTETYWCTLLSIHGARRKKLITCLKENLNKFHKDVSTPPNNSEIYFLLSLLGDMSGVWIQMGTAKTHCH